MCERESSSYERGNSLTERVYASIQEVAFCDERLNFYIESMDFGIVSAASCFERSDFCSLLLLTVPNGHWATESRTTSM